LHLPIDNKLNCDFYFPTPVWWNDLKKYDDSELLKLHEWLKKDDPKGKELSNFGGWQSRAFLPEDFPATNEFAKIMEDLSIACLEDYGLSPDKHKLKLGNIWFNENKGKDVNQLHIHGGSFLAGTYYLSIPNGAGEIIFYRNYMEEYALYAHSGDFERITPINGITARYRPRNKRVVLFPAWLQHGVLPSETNEPRISIAFNLKVRDV
tara:strand:- start:113 stop:736 length:624 start_codon:yes stop_codon:yes gene_type:complete